MPTTAQKANLDAARKTKNDEFYTQLSDIEKELRHYQHHFKGKVVYCNCDDPKVSNFFRHFYRYFEHLQLKKLISVCYKNDNPDIFTENKSKKSIYIVCDGRTDAKGRIKKFRRCLKKDGDFRSDESITLLQEADIVVTNPPFSLFREYVAQLIQYDKKFVIIGSLNAAAYKEIFPLLKENKVWMGAGAGGVKWFGVPDGFDITTRTGAKTEEGKNYMSMGNTVWYTNLDISKRHEELILYKTYCGNESEYPKYDNCDAINVDKVKEIPADYAGVTGVPISFLDKYNPDQFSIVGFRKGNDGKDLTLNGKYPFMRILIKTKRLQS